MNRQLKQMSCRRQSNVTIRGLAAWLVAVILSPLLLVERADAGEKPVVTAFDAGPVGRASATFNGELSAGLDAAVTVRWGTDENAWSHTNAVTVWTNETPHRLSFAATELAAGTEYSYQFHAWNGDGDDLSTVKTFTTIAAMGGFAGGGFDGYDKRSDRHGLDYPQVRNAAVGATNVTTETAWLNGMLLSTGAVAISAVRVYYGQTDGGTDTNAWDDSHSFVAAEAMTPLTVSVSVDSGSTYYYRFYAINANGQEGWASSSVEFLTPSEPAVSSTAAAPVGRASATLNGALTAGLTADITFYWGTNPDAWTYTNNIGWRSEGPLALPVTGLDPGTTYTFAIAAVNDFGADDSDRVEFTTIAAMGGFAGGGFDGYDKRSDRHGLDYPQVRNAAVGATNVTIETAWLNGMLLSTGAVAISAVRVYYGQTDGGTNVNAWALNHDFVAAEAMTPLTVNVSVDSGSTYYYRFYAINANDQEGWASSSVEFLTPSAPTVSSAAAAPVGRASATLLGSLTAGLTADITFYWGTNPDSWSYTNNIGWRSEGPLALPVTGLNPGSAYTFEIVAVNDFGADDSDRIGFTTIAAMGGFAGGAFDGYDFLTRGGMIFPLSGTLMLLR